MMLTPEMSATKKQNVRDPAAKAAPKPWTAPDFVERSTCAEIGAYAFQDK